MKFDDVILNDLKNREVLGEDQPRDSKGRFAAGNVSGVHDELISKGYKHDYSMGHAEGTMHTYSHKEKGTRLVVYHPNNQKEPTWNEYQDRSGNPVAHGTGRESLRNHING